ncbi:28 kDa ribonucleoprotein, chloroplastic [Rosa sericea]
MAMAATCLNIPSPHSWIPSNTSPNTGVTISLKRFVFSSVPFSSLHRRLRYSKNRAGVLTALAVVEHEQAVSLVAEEEEQGVDDNGYEEQHEHERHSADVSGEEGLEMEKQNRQPRPCELYVCNLPRSSDIEDLMEMFKPHGTVFSVEISRSPETGLSRGCGYITMGSIDSAKAAIAALDGIDVAGREMRVRFSVHMSPRTRNSEALNSAPVKNLVYESPYKLYVGNLAWAVQPHALRSHFSKFGTVASARVLHDRKAGKNRAYGFISFSSAAERDKAASLDGTEFCGRRIIVRGLKERA